MARQKKYSETKKVDGYSVNYESEEGKTWAVIHCPNHCGWSSESIGLSLDPGKVAVGKLKAHLKNCPNSN